MSLDTGSFEPDLAMWEPWRPHELAVRLEGVEASWYVLAGWALDLFQGRQTRTHEDIEIGVSEHEFGAIREALSDLELFVVGDGRAWPITESTLAAHRQTWAREPETGLWRLDVIRERWDGRMWVFARDPRIRVPGDALVLRTGDGIPFIRPEIALLFKAKTPRPKDESDFKAVLPLLAQESRAWLAGSLALVHPGHRWLTELGSS
jgi:aminoglycoside-2''-adenylyltransferase